MEVVMPDKGEIMPPGTPKHATPEPSTSDPPMFYPRPSSERAQDVSHILASTFRDLYTRDVMGKDTVKNLTTSSEGSNEFHKKCMKQLKEAHEEHKRRLDEFTMLEQHIIQARARAISADERALILAANETTPQKYLELGLPAVKSNFRWCLQEDLLRKHNLLVPSDLLPKSMSLVDGPKPTHLPHFAVPTLSSSMHLLKGPVDDGYTSKEDLIGCEELNLRVEDDVDGMTTLSTNSEIFTSSPPRTLIQSHRQKLTRKEKRDRWEEHMSHDQRVADRSGLTRMEERHNFLKNPRYLPLSVSKASKLLIKDQPKQLVEKAGRIIMEDKCPDEPIQVFISKPNVVFFTEWSVGRVYEAVLELKNISCVSRQLRVIPPTTSFFSIGLGKYPGVHGLVAPGMSAQFNVRFMPDSLAVYEDYIMVVSQAEEPLKVEIRAKRKAPILTMPRNLHCGQCLVGGSKVEELVLKNNGGSGRFCILKKTSWPAANFKTVVSPGSLDLGAFQIRPAVFEILEGQTMVIEMMLCPMETKKYMEKLVIVCDNCQVQDLTIDGEGQAAAVELVSVSDGGEDQPRLGEISDMTADHLIRFPPLNPHSFYMKQVLVHNSINVEMPYTWHILKPNIQTSLRPDEQNLMDRFEFYPDNSPAFFIEPQRGTLQPNGIHEFVVTFAPHVVGSYHNVLHLVLSNIPESSAGENTQARKDPGCNVAQEGIPSQQVGRKPPLVASSTGPEQLPKRESSMKTGNPAVSGSMNSKSGGGQLREVIALEMELKGESIPYSVLLHPPAIVVPGSVLEGTTVKRPFKMANYSLAPVQYKWSSESQPNIVEVEPPLGVIDPGEYAELEVSITGSKPGPLESNLQCKVEHLEHPLNMRIRATIEGPRVEIGNSIVDFGLVRLGDTVSQKVTLRNTTQLPAIWTFRESEHFYKSAGLDESEIQISPDFGEISPLGLVELIITFKPSRTRQLSTVLDLEVKDGKPSNLSVTADIQTPQTCFENCEIVCKDAYLSVPQIEKAFLLNLTSLTAKFRFGKLKGKQTRDCNIIVHPKKGILAPRERLEIQITFVCHTVGEVSSLAMPCYVEGVDRPVVLGFYANIKPLAVSYATPDSDCEELKVKFDDPVKLGSVVTKKIAFENLTAIRAEYSVAVQNFPTKPPAPPSVKYDFKSANTRRAMLGRTPNLADPMAKSKRQLLKDHCSLMLSSGQGAAFVVKRSHGFLEPYQTQVVEIEAYSNMWGDYNDVVDCNIEGLTTRHIPLKMNVTGCPLSFQVVTGQEENVAVVHFGTHINDGPQVSRRMRLNNSSPNDIRVDWRVFKTTEIGDKKLLDLNVWYGLAFPRKDSEGKEIVPHAHKREHDSYSPKTESTARSNLTEEWTPRDAQPKIVDLRLEPHHGQLSALPFTIIPSQSVIPARGHVFITVLFLPILGENSKIGEKEWNSYAHGFMSLDDQKVKEVPDKLSRLDGYSVSPLKLQMTALVRTGSLRIEPDDDEDEKEEREGGIQFRIPISDMLLLNSRVASEAVRYRHCTLLNDTAMPFDFNMSILRPFFLSSSLPTVDKLGNRISKEVRIERSARNRLRPQENMRVKIGFKLSGVILEVLKSLREEETVPGVQLERDSTTGAESMLFRDKLEISFSNGEEQAMSVRSKVFVPRLLLSVTELDFGTCFIGREKCLQFKIQNVGEAHSLWNAFSESGENSRNSDCFRLEPSNGFLEGYTSHLTENKMIISLYFIASSDQESSSVFTFRGVLGEYSQQILVRGTGSYDGKYDEK